MDASAARHNRGPAPRCVMRVAMWVLLATGVLLLALAATGLGPGMPVALMGAVLVGLGIFLALLRVSETSHHGRRRVF